ncbi:MAG TPA: glycosyltransferase family 39 protein [Acidimicrobiales bacterium]|nr:glycosyltransferase family 39 protein [Acidimicrobiales bacterium]
MSDEVEEGRGAGSDGDATAVDDRPEVDDEPGSGPPSLRRPSRTWWLVLLAIVVVALGVRVGYTLGWKQVDTIAGDPYYYHRGANLLADGHGFVHPYAFDKGVTIPAADHPPGYILVLAAPSLVGLDTILAHQLVGSLLGAGTVLLLGLAGRRIAGDLAGLIAAGIGALYPALWLNDAALMSESLALLCGTFVILAAYRAWEAPTVARFAVTGLAIGVATLARAEALMLVGLLAVPLALWVPGLRGARARLGRFGLAAGAAVVVISPWVVANLVRFEEPATLSTQMGPTLEAANCDETFFGPGIGSWSLACVTDWGDRDRSELDRLSRETALDYVDDHRDRVPEVLVARVLRTFHLAHVSNQVDIDGFAEDRSVGAVRAGVGAFWAVALAAIAGLVVMRRRGVPSFPLWTTVLNVLVTVLLFYGSTRFRAPAEPAFVLAAAVAVDAAVRRLRRQPVPAG